MRAHTLVVMTTKKSIIMLFQSVLSCEFRGLRVRQGNNFFFFRNTMISHDRLGIFEEFFSP